MLRGLGAGLATVSVGTLVAPRWVGASDLSLSDRVDLLYSNQFHFNERGQPQITIGLMEGQTRVRLGAAGGLRVLPSGDGGTSIEGGTRFEIELREGTPGEQRFTVVLEELTALAPRAIDRAIERWTARGLEPKDHEVGTVFGVNGHVLDNRRVLLTTGTFGSEAVALEHARKLKDDHRALGKLHPIVERRSRGVIVARDLDRDVSITVEGVLWFSPKAGTITVHDLLSGTTMGKGRREDREYRGSIYVAVDRRGKLAVVNLVSETDVLAGLVPAEIFASAPMAALEAQAVAARGQLVSKVGTRHLDDPFLLCAEQHCQVYAGRMREHPRTTKAVEQTAGWVAMRSGGSQLVDTVYCANSGGFTEHNDNVWPSDPDPQLRGRPDPLLPAAFRGGIDAANLGAWLLGTPSSYSRPAQESHLEAYRWRESLDPAALAGNPFLPKKLGTIVQIDVLARGVSGRATRVRVAGKGGSVVIDGELRIRRALGGLKSSMFQLVGGGHGHGVGLCQHGAMGMAAAGKSYRQILAHYYAGARPTKLW